MGRDLAQQYPSAQAWFDRANAALVLAAAGAMGLDVAVAADALASVHDVAAPHPSTTAPTAPPLAYRRTPYPVAGVPSASTIATARPAVGRSPSLYGSASTMPARGAVTG